MAGHRTMQHQNRGMSFQRASYCTLIAIQGQIGVNIDPRGTVKFQHISVLYLKASRRATACPRNYAIVATHLDEENKLMAKVGYIGLGIMGASIVRNLMKAGHELVIHN